MKKNIKISIIRIITPILITIAFAIVMLLGLVYITVKGPSISAKEEFVVDMSNSSFDWVSGIFLSDEEINQILNK